MTKQLDKKAIEEFRYHVHSAKIAVEETQESLTYALRSLGNQLLREADRIDVDKIGSIVKTTDGEFFGIPINSLGVVQSSGSDIDRKCWELRQQARQYIDLVRLVKRMGLNDVAAS